MLMGVTEDDWATVLRVFTASCSRRKGRNDRRFLDPRRSDYDRLASGSRGAVLG